MAKQGINPIEQHVEKIVLGVSALLFLFVVFSYVISTPVTVAMKGQTISPYDLDRQLGEVADSVARAYKGAVFTPSTPAGGEGGTEKALDELKTSVGLLDKMPTTMVSPVAWWPEMPKVESKIGPEGAHGVPAINTPVVSEVNTGVTNAVLMARPIDGMNDPAGLAASLAPGQARTASGGLGQDSAWAFLKLSFDMQQQYEIFRQNGYSREQANIILFTDIQVQRQRVRPDGSTGAWEDITPYKVVSFASAPTKVAITPEGAVDKMDAQRVQQLFRNLTDTQTLLLFPLPQFVGGDPFPPSLTDGVLKPVAVEAKPARPVAGAAESTARSVVRSPSRSSGMRGPGGGGRAEEPRAAGGGSGRISGARPSGHAAGGRGEDPSHGGVTRGPAPAGAPGRSGVDPAAVQAMSKAEQAYKQKLYTEAERYLEEARVAGAAQNPLFPKLQQKITAALEAWRAKEANDRQRDQDKSNRNVDIWIYDFQAQPGKTYRYRSRVGIFNVFSHPDIERTELKNAQDGAQVILTSDWSEPSQPVTIASPLRFFLTGVSSTGDSATVELFRFLQGQWFSQTAHVGSGEFIGDIKPKDTKNNRPEVDFRTGYTVVDIGLDPRAIVEATADADTVKVRPASSPVLVYMDDDGTIQQRWSSRDGRCQLKKELEYKVKQSADTAASPVAPPPVAPTAPRPAAPVPAGTGVRAAPTQTAAAGAPAR